MTPKILNHFQHTVVVRYAESRESLLTPPSNTRVILTPLCSYLPLSTGMTCVLLPADRTSQRDICVCDYMIKVPKITALDLVGVAHSPVGFEEEAMS